MLKKFFCFVYKQWLNKFVDEKTDPLVVVLDKLFESKCKYCMTTRAVVFGIGLGLFSWVGLVFCVLSIASTIGEKYWLCDLTKDEDKK